MKIHKVGDRKCFVAKKDGEWIQILFIPSARENGYYVIIEELETKKYSCSINTKEEIINKFGNDIWEQFNNQKLKL